MEATPGIPAHPVERPEAVPGTGTLDCSATGSPKSAICNLQYAVFLALLIALVGCAHRKAPPPATVPEVTAVRPGAVEKGIASWYGEPYHGRRTASGEVYDMHRVSAAHRTLPFGTLVRVTRRDTGQSVEVRINDRGPFIEGRIIDLSYGAARRIDLDVDGIAPVKVEVLGRTKKVRPAPQRPPPSAATACWWVQVGPVDSETDARKIRARIRDDWPEAQLVGCGG
jgi:rare lipoprotein A